MYETWRHNKFQKITGKENPRNFKELLGFLTCNKGRDCFMKFQGHVWMITGEGTMQKVCRNIPDLTFEEYLNLTK